MFDINASGTTRMCNSTDFSKFQPWRVLTGKSQWRPASSGIKHLHQAKCQESWGS